MVRKHFEEIVPGLGWESRSFRLEKLQNESSPNFSNFCPQFSEFF